jgi:hypothetical protein
MPDARCTRGLVCNYSDERTRGTTSTPESPGIPARNGFTAYFEPPGDRLFCHPHFAD